MIIYDKTIWKTDETPLNAENLQKIEDGIEYLFDLNRDVPEAENLRVQAENTRVTQEGLRQSSEIERNKKVDTSISDMNSAKATMQSTLNNKIIEVDSKVNGKISEADNKIVEVESRFLYLTANQQQSSEVLDARLSVGGTRYTSLKERIDSIETKPSVIWETVEG